MIEKILEILNRYENILILGFGREGKTSYNFIRKHLPNKHLTILDENQIGEINDENTDILIEKISVERLKQFDLIVKTPGISFKGMNTEGLNITSQLELLLEVDRQNVIAITGTKGKSTTTTLLYEVVKNQKENTFLLGNIGVPIFEQIENFNEDSTLIIECSSHQLQYIKTSPHIAILLNLYPEHLDHYNNLQEYYDSKLNIFKYQTEGDFAIIDEQVIKASLCKGGEPRIGSVGGKIGTPSIPLHKGDHPKNGVTPITEGGLSCATKIEIGKDIFVQGDFVVMNKASLCKGGEPRIGSVGGKTGTPSIPLHKGDHPKNGMTPITEGGLSAGQKITIGKDIFVQGDFVVMNKASLMKGGEPRIGSVGGKIGTPSIPLHKWDSIVEIYNVNEKRNLLGEHNLRNIMNIFVVCDILGLDFEKAKKVISEFKPLEHRMELVGTFDGVTYYNDSIATIPESTINSLKSIPNVNTLILGGMDRGIDYSKLIDFVNSSNVGNVICLPKTGHDLLPSLTKKTYKVDNLPEAVKIAKEVTKKGTVCLLSPAASSYTFFKNFEERGRMFKELVKN